MHSIGLTCKQRAEIDNKRKNRIKSVRKQSNVIAQQVRAKVKCEKEIQLKRIEEIKKRELDEWRRRRQCEIQQEYGNCLVDLGAAHIAACNASCEEDESAKQRREEYDLMAAERGRRSMLAEQRKRDREAEERLAKRKRNYQRNAAVQADLRWSRPAASPIEDDLQEFEDEFSEDGTRVETFTSKPNPHQSHNYNPKNFTSHSVDSSNNGDSEESSSDEFNQISNILRKKFAASQQPPSKQDVDIVELSESSDKELEPESAPKSVPKKGILKKPLTPKKKVTESKKPVSTAPNTDNQGVTYVDFGNKFTSRYIPNKNLVTQNFPTSKSNAKTEAQKKQDSFKGGISNDVLRKLTELRSMEALEKEKTRRDYERLRSELDELAMAANESNNNKAHSAVADLNKQRAKTAKMNQAIEKSLKRNIVTVPPVDSSKNAKKSVSDVNVASVGNETKAPSEHDKLETRSDINNMVKIERLRDLLERINHQKNLLLRDIERNEDIPGPDLDCVSERIRKLEIEKATIDKEKLAPILDSKPSEISERERQLKERELQFEKKLKELYQKHKKLISNAPGKSDSETTSTTSSDGISVTAPVEIIIKVQSSKPSHKTRKTIRCIDTLHREPGKVYPRTPRKKVKVAKDADEASLNEVVSKTVPKETQTSPTVSEIIKPILKNSSQQPSPGSFASRKSDLSEQSASTSYQSLPDKIVVGIERSAKSHQKLNPVLMHYITRLLGMGKNIGNQLSVSASTVSTPGSSTINTTDNRDSSESPEKAELPGFDEKRLQQLRDFINQNYSFLSEVNESLERSQIQEQKAADISKVEGLWRDALRKKKPKTLSVESRAPAKAANKEITKSTKVAEPQKVTRIDPKPPSRNQTSVHSSRAPPNTIVPQRSSNVTATRTSTIGSGPRPVQITNKDMLNVTKYLESHMLNNFTEYTANCQKRIEDLAQMMEQVRQEKLKLIENSLSSGEFGHFTEYREIVVSGQNQDQPTTSASDLKESPSQQEDPPSEEINNILQKQTRSFGVSKDSGISMLSRPVTSSDFRDSPDVRVTSEERENTFQPILKDIPNIQKSKPTETGSAQTLQNIYLQIKEQEEKAAQRKQKRPVSLNRFSPHLEKSHKAHELSTIAEVETPSASKVNLIEKLEETHISGMHSFPNFEEYMKATNEGDADVQPMVGSETLDALKLKSFFTPREYGIEESILDDDSNVPSNASSIQDIAEELRRREIVQMPLDNNDEKLTPSTSGQHVAELASPVKKSAQSRAKKTSNDVKEAPHEKVQDSGSPKSNDTLSGINEIPKEHPDDLQTDLRRMGLNWASTMMKRGGESKNLESSSSSTSIEAGKSIEIEITTKTSTCDNSSSSSSTGQPLNLRQFLARELTKRSQIDRTLSNESSLSSQFMRSLLNASGTSNSGSNKNSPSSDRENARTSTPVHAKDRSQQQKKTNTQLFAAESLSTLKASEASESDSHEKSN